MSLFVGNVSKHVSQKQFEKLFNHYGPCRIDLRDRYAFVQFDSDTDAEEAKRNLQNKPFHGLDLNIQWSKNSGRFSENNRKRGGDRRRSRSRENRWRRDGGGYGRRSPSYERRNSPSYSGNKNVDTQKFVPQCPRDEIIFQKLKAKLQVKKDFQKRQEGEMVDENVPPIEEEKTPAVAPVASASAQQELENSVSVKQEKSKQ